MGIGQKNSTDFALLQNLLWPNVWCIDASIISSQDEVHTSAVHWSQRSRPITTLRRKLIHLQYLASFLHEVRSRRVHPRVIFRWTDQQNATAARRSNNSWRSTLDRGPRQKTSSTSFKRDHMRPAPEAQRSTWTRQNWACVWAMQS